MTTLTTILRMVDGNDGEPGMLYKCESIMMNTGWGKNENSDEDEDVLGKDAKETQDEEKMATLSDYEGHENIMIVTKYMVGYTLV